MQGHAPRAGISPRGSLSCLAPHAGRSLAIYHGIQRRARRATQMAYRVELPGKWIDAAALESALGSGSGPHRSMESSVLFSIPAGAALMVDAGVRLLSLSNQLRHVGKRVTLEFSREDTSTYDYLNRIGFFDELDPGINVRPARPLYSAATRYHGANSGLVEIERLVPGQIDREIPTRLEKALVGSIRDGDRRQLVAAAAYDLFSELIGNVDDHSRTQVSGYAVLQVYKNGARMAVSDSGEGLLDTLRPSLPEHYPRLASLGPTDLLIHALRNGGLSCKGKGRGGGGLKRCADHAMNLQANLEIRLSDYSLRVRGKHRGFRKADAQTVENMPLLWGTHVVFERRTSTSSLPSVPTLVLTSRHRTLQESSHSATLIS
jgi:hypothetical protein